MMKARLLLLSSLLIFLNSLTAQSQDCDVLVMKRPVPETDAFIHTTHDYTVDTQNGGLTFRALTAHDAVAMVFVVLNGMGGCVGEKSTVYVHFANGGNLAMANAGGENCAAKYVLYFSEALGNMPLLELFKTEKIRYVKLENTKGTWSKIALEDAMAYNVKRSLNCLAEKIGAPVTATAVEVIKNVSTAYDSISESDIFTQPEFDGGDRALRAFFARNMSSHSIVDRGVVIATFMIGKDGSVSDGRVIRGVNEEFDKEAHHLISILPKWKPATKNGVPIAAKVKVAIPF